MKHKILLFKHALAAFLSVRSLGRSRVAGVFTLVFAAALLSSCGVDDFTEAVPDDMNNAAPTVTISSPTAGVTLKGYNDNDFHASFADSDIGLSQAQFVVTNEDGETFIDESFTLIGTEDETSYTLVADTLMPGDYILTIVASDTQGKVSSQQVGFSVRNPFSEQPMMNIVGSFNGWSNSENPMELIDDYQWVTQDSVTLTAADEFLFIADPSFDPKFGDGDCDMVAELGGANTACLYSGTFAVYFNDQTLEYSLEGVVVLASNQDEMFVLGSMNGWGGTDLQMSLVDDFTWQVEEVSIMPSDEFKFANTSDFSGEDWTDDGCDGVAASGVGLPNISCGFDGVFTLTFNDQTLEYSVE